MLPKIILRAVGRALGIGLLFALSYRVLGARPHAATWVFLGTAIVAFSAHGAWREVQAGKPRLP